MFFKNYQLHDFQEEKLYQSLSTSKRNLSSKLFFDKLVVAHKTWLDSCYCHTISSRYIMFQIVLHSIQSIYTRKGDNRLVLSCFISNFGPFIKPSTYGSSNQAPSCPLVMWNGLISPRKNGWRGNGNKMQIHRGLNEVNVMEHIKKIS